MFAGHRALKIQVQVLTELVAALQDPVKYARAQQLLRLNEEIKQAKKVSLHAADLPLAVLAL